uniref:Glutamyl-tRNA(Gln) amidotransferase subunit A, mitochondrial n=1 Tax=Aceria tosichella TaxID=561515 RepID=A0A6G1S8Z9_9ACAR
MFPCIRDAHKSLLKCDISVTKLCNNAFDQIEATKNLNAFITIRREDALKEASKLDTLLKNNDQSKVHSTLFGIPISVKDNFCTNQILTTCGSKMLHNFVPPYDATVVSKLKKANSIIVGKTNMDEFAMGSSCTTSYYNCAANYWKRELLNGLTPSECKDPKRWFMAGGSSTGSAISVASGACFASIGTDTGGSTRQPASLTGCVGFKPTYGLISRFGLIPLAHCLDVVSILARNVDDTSLIFEHVIGQDENDLTSVDHKTVLKIDNWSSNSFNDRKIRIGIPEEFVCKGQLSSDVSSHYNETITRLSSLNTELVNIRLPSASLATECYTIISSAEIASNMSCYDGVKYGLSVPFNETGNRSFDRDEFFKCNRDAGFGPEVKKRILLGNYFMLSENREKYLQQAFKVRRLISEDFSRAFRLDKVDVILLPSTPTTSTSYWEWLSKQNDNKLFGEDYYLIPANLANVPSISLPSGLSSNNLPIGSQLIADRFHDRDLLMISKFFESTVFNRTYDASI